MSIVLTTKQRGQAGSDSYNRFEYQVHWIVCHIIGKLQDNTECIVFCEFHDDMAEFSTDNQQYQFYQIKTTQPCGAKNQLIQQGRYTDCVDELIFKVINAPTKRMKIEYV